MGFSGSLPLPRPARPPPGFPDRAPPRRAPPRPLRPRPPRPQPLVPLPPHPDPDVWPDRDAKRLGRLDRPRVAGPPYSPSLGSLDPGPGPAAVHPLLRDPADRRPLADPAALAAPAAGPRVSSHPPRPPPSSPSGSARPTRDPSSTPCSSSPASQSARGPWRWCGIMGPPP